MAYIMIRVEAPNVSVGDMNAKLTDSTKPHDGVELLRNLMDACLARGIPAQVDVAVRETTQAIAADGDGDTASYNLK